VGGPAAREEFYGSDLVWRLGLDRLGV